LGSTRDAEEWLRQFDSLLEAARAEEEAEIKQQVVYSGLVAASDSRTTWLMPMLPSNSSQTGLTTHFVGTKVHRAMEKAEKTLQASKCNWILAMLSAGLLAPAA
jgi:hypothetical protein